LAAFIRGCAVYCRVRPSQGTLSAMLHPAARQSRTRPVAQRDVGDGNRLREIALFARAKSGFFDSVKSCEFRPLGEGLDLGFSRHKLGTFLNVIRRLSMGQDVRPETLKAKHIEIDTLLIEEERRPLPDFQLVHELKRKKLKIKDELRRFAVS
jgi:hypothetical protein